LYLALTFPDAIAPKHFWSAVFWIWRLCKCKFLWDSKSPQPVHYSLDIGRVHVLSAVDFQVVKKRRKGAMNFWDWRVKMNQVLWRNRYSHWPMSQKLPRKTLETTFTLWSRFVNFARVLKTLWDLVTRYLQTARVFVLEAAKNGGNASSYGTMFFPI
jgi:hypothetical protein